MRAAPPQRRATPARRPCGYMGSMWRDRTAMSSATAARSVVCPTVAGHRARQYAAAAFVSFHHPHGGGEHIRRSAALRAGHGTQWALGGIRGATEVLPPSGGGRRWRLTTSRAPVSGARFSPSARLHSRKGLPRARTPFPRGVVWMCARSPSKYANGAQPP